MIYIVLILCAAFVLYSFSLRKKIEEDSNSYYPQDIKGLPTHYRKGKELFKNTKNYSAKKMTVYGWIPIWDKTTTQDLNE